MSGYTTGKRGAESDLPPLFRTTKQGPRVFTVRELTIRLKNHVEERFADVWVSGEVGQLNDHRAGKFFSLKDEDALIEAVIWRQGMRRVLSFELETGTQVIAHGHIDLWAKGGRYKLVVDRIEPKGLGALQKKFEELKKKLKAEGLFEEGRKRPLPFLPRRIGLVTAPQGAAVRDMITTILGRFPRASLLLRPSKVQGDGAAREVARSIKDLNEIGGVDVLIVGRGGGSLEDLWAFNEEEVARAIAASKIPVISAVGHEVDFTISDFVADRRAKTPTDAGVMVVPRLDELEATLTDRGARLGQVVARGLRERRENLQSLRQHWVFRRPVDLVHNLRQELESRLESLTRILKDQVRLRSDRMHGASKKILRLHPATRLAEQAGKWEALRGRANSSMLKILAAKRESFRLLGEKLEGRSPVAILSRGYSLTRRPGKKGLVTDASVLRKGDPMETTFHTGKVLSRVEEVQES